MGIKIFAAGKSKRHKISKCMIDFKTDHLLHDKKQYPVKADYYNSCHNPLHQNRNQDCHGNHKNKCDIATAAITNKLLCICDMEYREKVSSLLYIYSPPPENPKGIIFTKK